MKTIHKVNGELRRTTVDCHSQDGTIKVSFGGVLYRSDASQYGNQTGVAIFVKDDRVAGGWYQRDLLDTRYDKRLNNPTRGNLRTVLKEYIRTKYPTLVIPRRADW